MNNKNTGRVSSLTAADRRDEVAKIGLNRYSREGVRSGRVGGLCVCVASLVPFFVFHVPSVVYSSLIFAAGPGSSKTTHEQRKEMDHRGRTPCAPR